MARNTGRGSRTDTEPRRFQQWKAQGGRFEHQMKGGPVSECLCWWDWIYERPEDTSPQRAVCIRWDPDCPTHTTKPRSAP